MIWYSFWSIKGWPCWRSGTTREEMLHGKVKVNDQVLHLSNKVAAPSMECLMGKILERLSLIVPTLFTSKGLDVISAHRRWFYVQRKGYLGPGFWIVSLRRGTTCSWCIVKVVGKLLRYDTGTPSMSLAWHRRSHSPRVYLAKALTLPLFVGSWASSWTARMGVKAAKHIPLCISVRSTME